MRAEARAALFINLGADTYHGNASWTVADFPKPMGEKPNCDTTEPSKG
jgi:hypothetical protein